MSKVLEALDYIKCCGLYATRDERKRLQFVHIKEIRPEDLNVIEKELKALEIIKEKRVDIGWLIRSKNCSKYNLGVGESQALKKEEYDLLKEVLR